MAENPSGDTKVDVAPLVENSFGNVKSKVPPSLVENLEAVADMTRYVGSFDVIIIGADVTKVEDSKRFVDETVNHFERST
jgi:hypothetical protein